MEIVGNPIPADLSTRSFHFGGPFRQSKDEDWKVKITDKTDKKKEQVSVLEFGSRDEAKEFMDDNTTSVRVYDVFLYDVVGNVIGKKTFFRSSDSTEYCKDKEKLELTNHERAKDEESDKAVSDLEKYLDLDKTDKSVDDRVNAKIALREKFRKKYSEKEAEYEGKAKEMMLAVAQFYLRGYDLNVEDYGTFKINLQHTRMSTLLMQLDIAKETVYRTLEEIQSAPKLNATLVKSQAEMQRLVLDITKFLQEYMKELEADVKTLRVDMDDDKFKDVEDIEYSEVADGTMVIADRRKFITEIQGIVKEAQTNKIPKSVNQKLHDDDPNLGDVVEIASDEVNVDDDRSIEGSGLESWDEE